MHCFVQLASKGGMSWIAAERLGNQVGARTASLHERFGCGDHEHSHPSVGAALFAFDDGCCPLLDRRQCGREPPLAFVVGSMVGRHTGSQQVGEQRAVSRHQVLVEGHQFVEIRARADESSRIHPSE